MTKNLTLIAILGMVAACGDTEEETTTNTSATTETGTTTSTNWWTTTETGTTTGTTGTTSTTGTTGYTGYGATNTWTITATDYTSGALALEYTDGGIYCYASATVSNFASGACADCYSSWLMDVGDITIDADGGGCDQLKLDEWANTTHGFGPGAPDYGEYHGLYYTGLWSLSSDGSWKVDNAGYSASTEDGGVTTWYFGAK